MLRICTHKVSLLWNLTDLKREKGSSTAATTPLGDNDNDFDLSGQGLEVLIILIILLT